jgi:RNA polymerase sigma-70 factor, ECF subfamily
MISVLSVTLSLGPTMTESLRPGREPVRSDPDTPVEAESSLTLIQRARDGSEAARNELCARYLPRLQRWAHGRLPSSARSGLDTVDLVQDTFIQVLRRIHEFEPRHEGAFQGYLRRTLINRIHDESRRVRRRGVAESLDSAQPASDPSPLEQAIGSEALERYDAALERLRDSDREAIILRIEMGYSYAELMEALDKPSVSAAQMTVRRALVQLAREMSRERP